MLGVCLRAFLTRYVVRKRRVQELCESRGGRPGLPVLISLVVSVDVKQHWTMLRYWSQFVPNMLTRHPRKLSSTSSPSTQALTTAMLKVVARIQMQVPVELVFTGVRPYR